MKLSRPERKQHSGDEMLPLINIVFLLIVFFLAVGHLDFGPKMKLPSATGQATSAAAPVSIDAGGVVRWDGEPLSERQIVVKAIDWTGQHPGKTLLVASSPRASAPAVLGLFQQLRLAGVQQVKLMTASGVASR